MMKFAIWFLSFASGFLGLSQEIGWSRLLSYAMHTLPHAFGLLLGAYLLGLSSGVYKGKEICARKDEPWGELTSVFIWAGASDLALPILWAAIAGFQSVSQLLIVAVGVVLVFLSGSLRGAAFPIIHQLGAATSRDRLGRELSYTYAINVLGATFGPLIANFVITDRYGTMGIFAFNAFAGLAIGYSLYSGRFRNSLQLTNILVAIVLCLLAGVLGLSVSNLLFSSSLQNFAEKGESARVAFWAETRHGIVHTLAMTGRSDDAVFGANLYDGRINIDLNEDTNGIKRAFAALSFHQNPRRLLVIGVGSGSWLRVFSLDSRIETVDVVEINPSYMDLIKTSPLISPVLLNPRIQFHIADGRRWLLTHPDARYDMIVTNTVYHWRALATNLLSIEFLGELRKHLNDRHSIVFGHTTESPEVVTTFSKAFAYTYCYENFVVASDSDVSDLFVKNSKSIWALKVDGVPLLDASDGRTKSSVEKMFNTPLVKAEDCEKKLATREPHIITDDNMITEFRYGRLRIGDWVR